MAIVGEAREARQGRETRRERILQAAAACLNERGVSQTSLSAIAARVGVSRAALYYYVRDQQDLVFQCYAQACEVMARRLGLARTQGAGALGIIDSFIDSMVIGDEPEIAVLSETAYLREEQRQVIQSLHASIMGELCDVLDTGMAHGEIRTLASPIVAQAIIGLVSWTPIARRWPTTMNIDGADLVEAIKTICMAGVAADRRPEFDYEPFSLPVPSIALKDLFDTDLLNRAKQEALLAAASWQFNMKGIEATSLEEIAQKVGVTPKVIYHNVGDKETLVAGCYRRAFDFYLSLAQRGSSYQGSRLQALCAVVHALAESTLREELAPLTPLAGFDSMPADAQQEIQDAAARLLATHVRLYADGQAEGSLRQFDIHAVLSIRHATHEWLPKWYGEASADEKACIPGELAAFFRLGLRPL